MARRRVRRDIYQDVTNRIVELLDAGTVPWRNPIRRRAGDGIPTNMVSRRPYRGINVFLLAVEAMQRGFTSDYWLTFKQAATKGGHIRQGERSSLVVFWKQIEKEDDVSGEKLTLPVLRHYNVFNLEQCEGLKPPEADSSHEPKPTAPLAVAEEIVTGFKDGPPIQHGGSRALYRPVTDEVLIPPAEIFESRESYYCTLFHELSHSTGHSRRLDRGLDSILAPFGSPDYSREELVAEMSAAFLSAHAGISDATISPSAAYIDHWRKRLKADSRLIVQTAGAAQKSADWILGYTFNEASHAKHSSDQNSPQESDRSGFTQPPSGQLELFK